jgi:hypothetical protein
MGVSGPSENKESFVFEITFTLDADRLSYVEFSLKHYIEETVTMLNNSFRVNFMRNFLICTHP